MIVVTITVTIVDDAARSAFSYLFPALSEVVSDTIDRALPLFFLCSAALLLAVAACLVPVALGTSWRRRGAGLPLPPSKMVLTLIMLIGCAGIAFLDAHLAGSSPRSSAHLDR